jgi:hypothetical protein
MVRGRHVEGALAADPDIGLGRRDQRLGARDAVALREGGRAGQEMVRQAVALRDVEDGEALEERHRIGLVAVPAGALRFVLGNESIGIANGGAALTLSDVAAQVQCLPEGQPKLLGEALLDDRGPDSSRADACSCPEAAFALITVTRVGRVMTEISHAARRVV